MSRIKNLSTEQARELSLLVELEAGWENMRFCPLPAQKSADVKDLQKKQKAYELFHSKLVAYNKGFRPPHVPEILLNTADRLGVWCLQMTELLRAAQHESHAYYPAHLIEKAYRWADRLSDRLKADHISRPTHSRNPLEASQELEHLAQWCESQSRSNAPAKSA